MKDTEDLGIRYSIRDKTLINTLKVVEQLSESVSARFMIKGVIDLLENDLNKEESMDKNVLEEIVKAGTDFYMNKYKKGLVKKVDVVKEDITTEKPWDKLEDKGYSDFMEYVRDVYESESHKEGYTRTFNTVLFDCWEVYSKTLSNK